MRVAGDEGGARAAFRRIFTPAAAPATACLADAPAMAAPSASEVIAAAGGRTRPVVAAAGVSSDAIRSAVPADRKAYPLEAGPTTGGEHCHSALDATGFHVRGPQYLRDKAKVAAGPALFDLMHVDIFLSHDKIGNVAARRDSWLRAAREAGDPRYYLVVLYVTPAAPFLHLILYYAVDEARLAALPHAARLWDAFTAHGPAGDAFRNERWKVIPRVAEGAWVVQKAVGAKPALLAQKLAHTWILNDGVADAPPAPPAPAAAAATSVGCDANLGGGHRARGGSVVSLAGPGPYLEADCDVASSSMAFVLVSLLQQYARYLVIDLGFAIEPRAEDECPEVVLGSVRLSRINVTRPPMLAADAGDMLLGSLTSCHAGGEGEGDEEEEEEEEEEERGGGGGAVGGRA